MNWFQLQVEVAGSQIEQTLQLFEMLGSQATTQQNAGEDSYFDLAHPAEPGWDRQLLTGLFEAQGSGDELVAAVIEGSDFIYDVELSQLEDQDWETLWLDQYQPVEIHRDLWVYPSWIEAPVECASTIIKIDPGMAFGTGTHETTRLCMGVLNEMDLKHKRVLDYGCGSGILAITALKLGAVSAVGVDIDSKAEQVSLENAHSNGVDSSFAIQSADTLGTDTFDVVVANILAFALIDLAAVLGAHCKPGGGIILSGILAHQADDVIAAYQHEFKLSRQLEGEWVVLFGQKFTSDHSA